MGQILAVALAVVAAFALRRFALGYPRLPPGFSQLSRREAAFLRALAEATFPASGAIPVSGVEADLPRYVDRWLSLLPRQKRLEIRLLLNFFEQATLVFPASGRGCFRRFSSLTPEQRICVLRRWSESRYYVRRLVFTGLRAIVTFGYLGDPRVLRHLNVAPRAIETPVCDADLLYPPVGQPSSAVRYSEADLTPPSDGTPIDPNGPLHPDYAEAAR